MCIRLYMYISLKIDKSQWCKKTYQVIAWGGGGSNPIFAHGKMCVFPIFPHGEKWEKKYMERKGKVFISLSFHILFSPWEKMGKHTFFHGQKWGWTPPPPIAYSLIKKVSLQRNIDI